MPIRNINGWYFLESINALWEIKICEFEKEYGRKTEA